MYARVARWEGADAGAMRATADRINSDASSGPPEGVQDYPADVRTHRGRCPYPVPDAALTSAPRPHARRCARGRRAHGRLRQLVVEWPAAYPGAKEIHSGPLAAARKVMRARTRAGSAPEA